MAVIPTCAPHMESRSEQGLGIGVQFTEFESGSREFLQQVIDRLSPPKSTGQPQHSTQPELAGSALALVAALRDHFEGNNA